jgi:hypothetical protein
VTAPTVTFFSVAVDVRFGKQGHETLLQNVARLSPLPSAKNPLLVFLGVKDDRQTALFLVSAQANPAGEGRCRPGPKHCELLELKPGEQESLLVVNNRGGADIYNLQVSAIRLKSTSAVDVAKAANAHVSVAGRKIVRRASEQSIGLHSVSYSSVTGTLSQHPVPKAWLEHLMQLAGGIPAGVVLNPV